MRISPGTPMEERYKALTPIQSAQLAHLAETRDAEADNIEEVKQWSYRGVKATLEAGVPAVVIADRLGITTGRVYQMMGASDEKWSEETAVNAARATQATD